MTLIAGASQYLSQSMLAQKDGSNFETTNVLAESVSASLLDVGRGNAVDGIGLSANARQLNKSFIEGNSSTYNEMFSLAGGGSATVDAAQIQIAGLRAKTNLSRDVLIQDDGNVSSVPNLGTNIDTEA